MKLSKNYHHFQILHLYEHVLACSLFNQMQSLNRWEYLDFYFNAQTLSNGLLLVEFQKYRRFNFNLKKLKLDLSDAIIDTAINTILNEKDAKLDNFNRQKIKTELTKIHQLPWHNAQDFYLENVNESSNFSLKKSEDQSQTIKLCQDFSKIPNKKSQQLAKMFITYFNVNFSSFLMKKLGFYPLETIDTDESITEVFKANKNAAHFESTLEEFKQNFITDHNLQLFFQQIVNAEVKNATLKQLKSTLSQIKTTFK